MAARKSGIKRLIVPIENSRQACLVDGIEVLGAKDIQQVLDHYTFVKNLPVIQKESFITEPEELDLLDFSEVKRTSSFLLYLIFILIPISSIY